MPRERQPRRVEIGTAVETDVAVGLTLKVGTHLWMHWLQIAAERERAAGAARALLLATDVRDSAFGDAMSAEMHAAMVAISAGANAIDALYGEVDPLIPVPEAVKNVWGRNRTSRPDRIFETLKLGCRLRHKTNEWPRQFTALYALRDPVVHHRIAHKPAVPHPSGKPTNVSQEAADYSVENVGPSLDLAFDVALTALTEPQAAQLVAWASNMRNVPDAVRAFRAAP